MSKPLVVFEMANNHQGNVERGANIILEYSEVAREFPQFSYAFKFQYRDWDTFCHPDYRERIDIPYVKRFRECALKDEEFLHLKQLASANGFATMCTPFDEVSVDKVVDHGYDYMKIGSPSIRDLDLLWRIKTRWMGPVFASLGGARTADIMFVYELFINRPLTLMHCVSEYPTEPHKVMVGQIRYIADKFFLADVGFSTHESPEGMGCALALAAGAEVFEWHVCSSPTPNGYSLTPHQSILRLEQLLKALVLTGETSSRYIGETPSQFLRQKTEDGTWWIPKTPQ